MKKHLHYALIFLFLACSLQAQVVGWNQPTTGTPTVFSVGTSTAGVETGRSICIDAAGNTYVYGTFAGTADFDPSAASATATANGTSSDLFIAKYNSTGAFQWVARGGVANSGDNGAGNFGSIKTDGTNVYVVGNLAVSTNSATFTPVGSCTTCTVPSNAATTRGFVGKLDAATGTWQWINTFGGTTTQNGGQGLCLDPIGNVYVSGQCSGTFTLGALPQISVTDPEVFFGKLSSGGVWQWATTAGGTGGDGAGQSGSGITYNTNLNRLAASGSYNSTTPAAFGSFSLAATSGGSNDIFLTEINPSTGAFLSAFGFGGTGTNDECGGIVYDPSTNDIFLAGQMSGNLTLPGFGTLAQASAGTNDIFVGRFTPNATPANGVFSWAKSYGLTGSDRAYDIATNANGNIYIAGWFSGAGTIDFAAGTPTQITSTGTDSEIFVAALTVGGTGVWAVQAEDTAATGIEQARGVCAAQNTSGTVYATGQFNTGTVSWTPSSNGNVISLTSAGTSDVWVAKIYGAIPTIVTTGTTTAFTSCTGAVSTAQNFTVSGSGLTANITVTAPTGFEVSLTAGSGYASSISLTQTGGTVATTTVYVRLSTTATGTPSGNVACTSTGATTRNVAVSGTVSAIILTAGSQTNVFCNGGANGSATVAPSGGLGAYTYSWAPSGGTAATATGLASGSYIVTVTDANLCTATRTFIITQPTAINTATGSQTNVSCNGGSNGTATVAPSGGTGPYTYSWAPSGGTGATTTGRTAGSYTVTVTDANLCTATRTFIITQPTAINTATGSQTNVSCNGGSNGTATVAPSGGTGPYTYSWAPSGGTGATTTGRTAGSYTVTVTDANLCTATRTFIITQPTAINTAAGSQTNVSCNGGSNGSATVAPSGGAGAYTYSWSPSGGTGATASGLSAGSYTVTVTDANSCTATRTFIITQPTAINTATGSQTNVSCNGGSNGTATVAPSGGTGPYTYSWAPSGGTAATALGLSAGSYTVTVTDANLCTATRTFIITQPTAINTAAGSQTNVACNGGSNGSATVAPSGGAGGYTYSWAPSGGTAATASGLSAGTYTVTVTDANSCTATRTFIITQPAALNNTVSLALGTLSANLSGATYQWYQCPNTLLSGATNQTYTPLVDGDYKVDITLSGCTVTSSCVTVVALGNNSFELFSKFKLYPNPTSGIINIDSDTNGDILIVNQLGQVVKTFSIKANALNQISIEELNEGTYFVKGTNGTNISAQKLIIKK
jgi:Secretion system C-terminal sorting domain/SprB repeat